MKEGEDRIVNYLHTKEYIGDCKHTTTTTTISPFCLTMEKILKEKPMKIKEPKNINYCATVMNISNIVPLDNCDNVVAAIVSGYQVIVNKEAKVGDLGVFFPVECKLSKEFLSNNNLFRDKEKNVDKTKGGYIEDNQRLKCVKFRGHKSEGLFMPLESLSWTEFDLENLDVGMEFDELNDKEICTKHLPKRSYVQGASNKKKNKVARVSRMIDNQFRLHVDTEQFKKNMWKISPYTKISISRKVHGTSAVIGNVLVKRKLSTIEKILKFVGVNIKDTEYDIVYSSRNVIKNEHFNPEKAGGGFYSENIWSIWANRVKGLIPKGITLYGEIVGYLPSGSEIQKNYSYGCNNGESMFFVYRVTQTNEDGQVIEYTKPMIDEFCEKTGLSGVCYFYYGLAKDMYPDIACDDNWNDNLLSRLESDESIGMNNADCVLNDNKVPSEGIVVRIESIYNPNPMKLKNFRFYEFETKMLDEGVEDIESSESEGENIEVPEED